MMFHLDSLIKSVAYAMDWPDNTQRAYHVISAYVHGIMGLPAHWAASLDEKHRAVIDNIQGIAAHAERQDIQHA